MAQDDALSLIAKRKAEIEASRAAEKAERERLDAIAADRAKEEEEIEIAERVFARLAQKAAASVSGLPSDPIPAVRAKPPTSNLLRQPPQKIPASGGSARPEGIPTVPQMVTELLLDAEKNGKRGLRSMDITAGINARWWPGVSTNLIMPTVYRCIAREYWFAKEGKLIVRLRGGQPPNRNGNQLKLDG